MNPSNVALQRWRDLEVQRTEYLRHVAAGQPTGPARNVVGPDLLFWPPEEWELLRVQVR